MSLRIVQISDTHLSRDHPQRTADLERCVAQINALDPQPDIVIHTGDIADYGMAEQYKIARPVLDKLKVPYFVLAGNRDDRKELLAAFADGGYLSKESAFIQYAIEQFDTRVLVIDTLCVGSNKGELCDIRLAHFEQMLAADMTRKVAVFMHHPPFQASVIPDPVQFVQWTDVDKFRDVLARYTNVCGVYCGHLHRTIDGTVGRLSASSISCMAGDLRRGDVSDADRKLPMFRTLRFA